MGKHKQPKRRIMEPSPDEYVYHMTLVPKVWGTLQKRVWNGNENHRAREFDKRVCLLETSEATP